LWKRGSCQRSLGQARSSSLISAIAQADGEAKTRLKAFLEKRAPKVVHKKTVRNKT